MKMEKTKTGIFKNENGYRIGWKILTAFLLFILSMILSIVPSVLICNFNHFAPIPEMINTTMGSSLGNALQEAFGMLMLFGMYCILVKKNQTSWKQLGLYGNLPTVLKSFGGGFLTGLFLVIINIALLCLLGYSSLSRYAKGLDAITAVLCGLVIYAGVAFSEEITFRGFIQGQFGKENTILGIAVTTILFAVIHLHNHSVYALIYLLAGGLAFSVMRIVTKGLWFPIGFHMAWDWVEISVFGLDVESTKHWLFTSLSEETADYLICAALCLIITGILLAFRKQKAA